MVAILRSVRTLLNSLLPFTDPSTPLAKDLIHASVLIAIFYFGPQWYDRWKARQSRLPNHQAVHEQPGHIEHEGQAANGPAADARGIRDANAEQDNDDEPIEDDEEDVDEEDLFPEGEAPNPAPGPANNPHNPPPRRDPARPIGKKKAAALARRDRQRAYNEFLRSQGDAQRAADAADAEAREEALLEEKRRRAVFEMGVEEKKRAAREEEKRREEDKRRGEWERREGVVKRAREGMEISGYVDLKEMGDDAEGLVRAGGLVGEKKNVRGKGLNLVTREGWLVNVGEEDMRELYRRAGEMGKANMSELARILENVMREKSRGQDV